MPIPQQFQLVPLAVGQTQTFKLADGRDVMVVAVPATSGQGGGGPSGGDTAGPNDPPGRRDPITTPTLPRGHAAAVVVADTDADLGAEDIDDLLAGDSLTLRIEPSRAADPIPGLRIISDDIMRATQSDEASEVVIRPGAISGNL